MMKMWLPVLLLSVPHLCRAQGNEIVIVSLHASSLSGVVVDTVDDSFPKVAVSRIQCGKGEFRGAVAPIVLQQVQTDANGNFAFPWSNHKRTCLQVETPGMNRLQAEVKYARGGGKLKLILSVGQ
jgi:hypothetical protein